MLPQDVDGRTLVIIRRHQHRSLLGPQFHVVASGQLEHDGDALTLIGDGDRRLITDEELASLMLVMPDTKLVACRGFDLTEAPDGFRCDDLREELPLAAALAWATSAWSLCVPAVRLSLLTISLLYTRT